MKKLKIFIYGALLEIEEPTASIIKNYCRDLGKTLSERGHTIIAISSNNIVVDNYFLEGMESSTVSGKAIICRSNDRMFPFQDDKYKNIELTFIHTPGQLNNSHICAINQSDIVLTICGTHKLDPEIGFQTVILHKPILALPFFGQGAEKIWKTVNEVYKAKNFLTLDEISEVSRVQNYIEPVRVVKLLESLSSRHKKSFNRGFSPATVLGITCVTMLLWAVAFLKPALLSLSYEAAFFIAIGSSSLLGIMLRISKNIAANENVNLSRNQIISDITVGLILGFIFSLAWIINNFILTGKGLTFTDASEFSRVTMVCSLITLGASFYLESSISKIKSEISGLKSI